MHNSEVCLVEYSYFSQMSLQFPNECTFLQCQHILKEIIHCEIEILEIICSLKHNFRKDYNASTMNTSISGVSRKAVQDCLAQWLAFTERDYDMAYQFIRLWKKDPCLMQRSWQLLDRNSVSNKPLPCNSGQREQNAKVCKYVRQMLVNVLTTDHTDGTQYLQPFYASLAMGNKVKS